MGRVSVLVPCFNEPEERVWPTVVSALHALADEVIVIDDGSAAPPLLPLSGSVHLHRQPHMGISVALNHARARARGEWLCWLSCGDTMYSDKIRYQREWMEREQALASFTSYRDTSADLRIDPSPHWETRIWTDNQFSGSTIMVHHTIWDKAGGFDESILWCQDWDFACRVQVVEGWGWVPEELGAGPIDGPGHTDRARRDLAAQKRRGQDRAKVHKRWRFGERLCELPTVCRPTAGQ